MTIVERVRKAMNVTSNAFDDEYRDIIEAARLDMIQSGVPVKIARDDDNAIIVQAIKCYVKSEQAWEEPTIAQAQLASYRAIVNVLSLCYGGDSD
jgi:hypothetical protein